ncbi:hypothetical protein DAPPUDRAFT_259744 [Daphnia pulex]|uniref:Uncharacterized protein n=1 Tax=Daphnia pulex TaxID=6669 RepID=E9HHS6_DAPPU|nr:hypothetical protein DAPPUDRAFT_259744 [Daphnia pulex]|eukprot:EFX68684.1 hypothetical protein DAPPUDRAFT_259744 [Daphnia pulex]
MSNQQRLIACEQWSCIVCLRRNAITKNNIAAFDYENERVLCMLVYTQVN